MKNLKLIFGKSNFRVFLAIGVIGSSLMVLSVTTSASVSTGNKYQENSGQFPCTNTAANCYDPDEAVAL